MTTAYLEHTNLSVSNPDQTAKTLQSLFDWKIRWSGESMEEGYTVHVGNENSYVALYSNTKIQDSRAQSHSQLLNLNHIAVVVNDLVETYKTAESLSLKPFNYAEYEPGRRFYVFIEDGLEVEIVSYY